MADKRPSKKSLQSNSLRIIAGQWRGRKLSFPTASGLRPTGDRVRETLFNWLQSEISGARCLDLFAGSGALGLEALSRGADTCVFVETNRTAAAAIAGNLRLLNANGGKVVQQDALEWLESGATTQPFTLIFCDPPFAEGLWQAAVDALEHSSQLAEGAWLYLELPKQQPLPQLLGWQLHREKTTGLVKFCLFQRHG